MKSCLFSSATALAIFASSQVASAYLPPSSTTPRMLEASLGGYSSVELDPALGAALDAHMAGIYAPANPAAVTRGAVLEVARYGKVVYSNAVGTKHGNPSQIPAPPPLGLNAGDSMATNVIFDLESMTKITTAVLIMRLAELGHLDLNDPVAMYIPEFTQSHVYNANFDGWADDDNDGVPDLVNDPMKAGVTVLDLMAYRGGLALDATGWDPVYGSADPWATMAHVPLDYAPGTTQMYSDMSYRLLGHIAEVAMLAPLHELVRTYVTGPLGMTDSDYEPSVYMSGNTIYYNTGAGVHKLKTANKLSRVAGTGPGSAGQRAYAWAEVQDDSDYWVQRSNVIKKDKNGNIINLVIGTSSAPSGTGCDGLFSTARDFMKLGQFFLNMGVRVAPPPQGTVCVRAPCTVSTPLLSAAGVADMTEVPAPTASFQPLIPSASYPQATSFGQHLIHSHKGYGWELSDGGPYSPSGQDSTVNVVTKTGGAGTYIKVDFANDTIAVLMTNHGLPDFSTIGVTPINEAPGYMITWGSFDAMLNEAGPAAVNDLVSTHIDCSGCM